MPTHSVNVANNISRRMVVLSASAIASIYAAGFALTRAADAGLSGASSTSAATPAIVTAAPTTAGLAPTAVIGASGSLATASSAAAYKDGTYAGQGTSRRGGVSVSVTIQGGAIANVQIISASTEYPVSRIASLPSAVVKQQTANVNVISGATYSSQAFKQAIQQALTVAQATSTTVAA